MEETGIQLEKVNYFASQPWPFPSSLMIGCIASAKTDSIQINKVIIFFIIGNSQRS
jgi:NAD+ diphosphatase